MNACERPPYSRWRHYLWTVLEFPGVCVDAWRERGRSGSSGGTPECDVYWGSHGCCLPRGHEGEHLCTCTFVDDDPSKPLLPHMDDDPEGGNVGRAPYYGPETYFYGDDVTPAEREGHEPEAPERPH